MSQCSICLKTLTPRAMATHERTCADSEPTLKDVMKLLHSLQRDIKELKKARVQERQEDEYVPVSFPTLDDADLQRFLQKDGTISEVIDRHEWPVRVQGRSLLIQNAVVGRWEVATANMLDTLAYRIRTLLKDVFEIHLQNTNMDKDSNSDLPECSQKIFNLSSDDVKRAFFLRT